MKQRLQIGDRRIGADEPVFIIAEIGSNHDQDRDQARLLIETAVEAGADAVKFQLYKADDLYPPGTPAFDTLKQAELPEDWLTMLMECSHELGVTFLASPFSRRAVDLLADMGVPAFKWASSETVNLPLLKHAAAKQKPILLSTGMCNLSDIHDALQITQTEGNADIVLLQCTSLYPTAPEDVHLRAMTTLGAAFQLPVGFSDHTMDTVIPAAAVACGACVIEKHLTLDRSLSGPDHGYALEPSEFRSMVDGIRRVEMALGSSQKLFLPEEMKLARRDSIRAAHDIAAGEILTEKMLALERPAQGISPRFLGVVLGRKIQVSVSKGEAITWDII